MIIVIPSISGFIILGLISFIGYILKNPEKLDKWSYLFNKYRLFKNERSSRKVISKNLDYKITSIAKRINSESDGILPFGLRIKWRNVNEIDSYVHEKEVFVVLKREDNNDKNIINTCSAFVPQALLPKSRNCIDTKILKSLDHFMIRSILSNGTYNSAYNYYLRTVFNPLVDSNGLIKRYINDFDKLNEIGFFTRILLEEYRRLGVKLYGTYGEQNYIQESLDFLFFLEVFASRSPGDYTRLTFFGENIKIGIVLVAKQWTLDNLGIKYYLDRIENLVDRGAQRIFIFSYAQRYDEIILDNNGYIQGVESKKEFLSLNSLEKKCRDSEKIHLIKKQNYTAKDVKGNHRSARYLVYESLR